MPSEAAQAARTASDADRQARWRTCLHEAGHAVAGRVLLGDTARVVVFTDDCGAAYLGRDASAPVSFEEVLAIAVGPAAEMLASRYTPPEAAPAPDIEETYPEPAGALKKGLRESLPDATAIARWCIARVEGQPDRWAGRCHWIRREARLFVARHQSQIVEAATHLFVRGIITLPAEPAKKGVANVD